MYVRALFLATLIMAAPLPAAHAAAEQSAWDVLLERGFGKSGMDFLVESGSAYVDSFQTPDIVEQSDAEGIPVPTERVIGLTRYYMSAVEPAIIAQFENSFSSHLSKQDIKLLLKGTAGSEGKSAFSCLFQSAPAADGTLPFDSCNVEASADYRAAAQNFLNGFNDALSSRLINDAFGGATCLAVDNVVAAYNTEAYELTINGSIGLGNGNSRACSLVKTRWAGLAGYDWLLASKEFGE